MKKYKSKKIIFNIIFLLFLGNFLFIIPFSDNNIEIKVQDGATPTLSNGDQILLHTYDFEDQTLGQNPTYETFTIDEGSGDVYIDDLGDGQQKHMALHKVGTTGRVWVRDNFSLDGETYVSGEYHLKVYHDNSGFGINLNSANGEYILAMVWQNGEIRDDVGGTFLANYALNQWIDVVIYFDLDLGWMFDLDGVKYGAGYSIPFFGAFTANAEHIWMTSFVSGGGDGYFRVDDISAFFDGINIVTPVNKTYTEPMSGYYPATYGFECDENNIFPKGWTDTSGANGYAKVIDGIGGHNKVLECYSSSADDSRVASSIFFDPQEHGSFEFWWYKSSSYTSLAAVDFWGETPGVCISIRVDHWPSANNDKVEYATDTGWFDTGYPYYTDNKWMHFRIDFNCSSDTYSLWIDQVKYLDNIDFHSSKDETGVNQMRFDSLNSANAVLYYVDAVRFSWDLGYSVGDNLNEGLLLSYENSTDLDWMGYSLDSQPNKTILGNTTFPMPENGLHTIQVFGNDSFGTNYNSEIRCFTVDYRPIKIITPENKTYTEPMSGYYPATYGFENDENGSDPYEWTVNEAGGTANILNELEGHKKVIELHDINSDMVNVSNYFNLIEHGTIECWVRSNDVTDRTFIEIKAGSSEGIFLILRDDDWQYWNSSGIVSIQKASGGNMDTPLNNIWYHIRIEFECGTSNYAGLAEDHWRVYINGIKSVDTDFFNGEVHNGLNVATFRTHATLANYYSYFDALGYSWDPYYTIGDNVYEGLLLSYENSIKLDWIGYSLDKEANKTILGNTTIPMPENGLHTIQVFGNDSFGTNYNSKIRYFTVTIEVKEEFVTFLQRYAPYIIFLIIAGLCGLIWFIKNKYK